MKIIFILLFINIFYNNNAMISEEKVNKIQEKYWNIHHTHVNASYENYKEVLEKFKKREYDTDDVLKRFKYFPNKENVNAETINTYINDLYNFTYHDGTCFLCFERAKRWYWLTYEKDDTILFK